MEQIAAYFENIPPAHRSLILVGGIAFFGLLESIIPMLSMKYDKWKHAGINIFFTVTTVLVNFCMAFLLLKASVWSIENGIGILTWLPKMSVLSTMIVGLLLLDFFGAYLSHYSEHKVKWMWKFHLVHHTDPHIDTTSANRHHPGESVIRFVFTTLGAIVVGAPWWVIMMYQSCSIALAQFTHANISYPNWLENALNCLFVTPRMHRVHHHYVLPQTDSNFGNIFSIWDRLFGTYIAMDNEKIIFGLDTHAKPQEQSHLGTLLKMPFQEYRSPVGAKFEE